MLLPGTLSLARLAFGARRRRWLMRVYLMSLVGLIAMLGTTACNPLYYYKNHGPSANLPTPAGTYTLAVTAQSSMVSGISLPSGSSTATSIPRKVSNCSAVARAWPRAR